MRPERAQEPLREPRFRQVVQTPRLDARSIWPAFGADLDHPCDNESVHDHIARPGAMTPRHDVSDAIG